MVRSIRRGAAGHSGGTRHRGRATGSRGLAAVAVLGGAITISAPAMAASVEPTVAEPTVAEPSGEGATEPSGEGAAEPSDDGLGAAAEGAVVEPGASPPRVRDGRHSLEVSYYGLDYLRPGAQIGYSVRALQSRRKLHALVVGADVGSYYWARHSIGVHVVPRVGWRGRHPKHGLQGEANLHLGYMQGVLPSEAFEVVNGKVQPSGRAGYPYMVVGPTVGIGYFIESIGVTPFLRTGVHWQYPIFDQAVVRFNVALGVEVRL